MSEVDYGLLIIVLAVLGIRETIHFIQRNRRGPR